MMICVQRIQRIIIAILLIATVGILHGNANGFYIATYILIFMAVMMFVWAITDFCPSIWLLRKFLPDCKFGKKSE